MSKLSICIPTYKRLDYLHKLVDSIPEEYPIYISDNGGFIPDYFFKRNNLQIKHLPEVIPMFSNWNNAINMVETEWFIIPGDDDVIFPEQLTLVEKNIDEYSDCAYIAYSYDLVDENDKVVGGWMPDRSKRYGKIDGFRIIQRSVPFRWPSIVINAEKSRSVGNFDESFSFTASDSLYLQTLAIKYPIALINNKIGQYRVWGDSFTNKRIFTKEWFDYLELWQQKLTSIVINEKVSGVNTTKNHDLAIFDNLLGAISINKAKSINERLSFIRQVGWPIKIGLINHLRLIYSIFS